MLFHEIKQVNYVSVIDRFTNLLNEVITHNAYLTNSLIIVYACTLIFKHKHNTNDV